MGSTPPRGDLLTLLLLRSNELIKYAIMIKNNENENAKYQNKETIS